MRKMTINGKEILTNLGEESATRLVRGDSLPNRTICLKDSYNESDKAFVARLAAAGYTSIRLVRTSTMIRGIYTTFAYCKRKGEQHEQGNKTRTQQGHGHHRGGEGPRGAGPL